MQSPGDAFGLGVQRFAVVVPGVEQVEHLVVRLARREQGVAGAG